MYRVKITPDRAVLKKTAGKNSSDCVNNFNITGKHSRPSAVLAMALLLLAQENLEHT